MPGCSPSSESGVSVDTAAQSNGAIGCLGAHVRTRSPSSSSYEISAAKLLMRDETRRIASNIVMLPLSVWKAVAATADSRKAFRISSMDSFLRVAGT